MAADPRDGLVDTGQAARELGVPADLISQWKRRGLVMPAHVIPGPGRTGETPFYDLEDLRPLARRYHRAVVRGRHRHAL